MNVRAARVPVSYALILRPLACAASGPALQCKSLDKDLIFATLAARVPAY